MSRACSFLLQFVFLFKYGSIPVSIYFWKIVVRPGVIAHSVSILLGNPSGQDIFYGLIAFISVSTPVCVIFEVGMTSWLWMCFVVCRVDINTDMNNGIQFQACLHIVILCYLKIFLYMVTICFPLLQIVCISQSYQSICDIVYRRSFKL